MSRRLAVLGLVVPFLVFTGCVPVGTGSGDVGPTIEPSLVRPPSPSPTDGLEPTASTVPSVSPGASGAIDPANFTSTVDNPWFPLLPGTMLTYQGTKDAKTAVETFTVTHATKVIAGVTCVVVEDRVSLGGVPAEKLLGYYAQDRAGNVWYFGEDMEELAPNGTVVSTDGSWHAGVDKAYAAFFLEGSPTVGHSYGHDYTKNNWAVVRLSDQVTVPYGTFAALVTKEWSPLEPDVESRKYYVRGVGVVRDVVVKGPTEEFVLVKVEHV